MRDRDITMKFDRQAVLNVLIANRDKHVQNYNAALIEWKSETFRALRKFLSKNKKTDPGLISAHAIGTLIGKYPKPYSHESEYNRVIGMLEMSSDSTIELNMNNFEKFIQDQWEWRLEFDNTISNYNKKQL